MRDVIPPAEPAAAAAGQPNNNNNNRNNRFHGRRNTRNPSGPQSKFCSTVPGLEDDVFDIGATANQPPERKTRIRPITHYAFYNEFLGF